MVRASASLSLSVSVADTYPSLRPEGYNHPDDQDVTPGLVGGILREAPVCTSSSFVFVVAWTSYRSRVNFELRMAMIRLTSRCPVISNDRAKECGRKTQKS